MAGVGIDTTSVDRAVGSVSSSKSGNTLDKEAFLKLLVTQMQYQDPLEPTSNTEYMSQLAQFSTVEQLENLTATFNTNQSLNMAGQYVILNVPDSSGKINQISGLVDFVTIKDGKAFFHINDDYYPAEYLDSVVSIDYLEHLINSVNPSTGGDKTDDDKNGGDEQNGGDDQTGGDDVETE